MCSVRNWTAGAKVGSSHRHRSTIGRKCLVPILEIMERLVRETRSDGQRAVRIAVQTNATSKGLLEAIEGEVGVVDEDDQVRCWNVPGVPPGKTLW